MTSTEPHKLPTVDIIIVNWNSKNLLRECCLSLASSIGADIHIGRVVVVDNASTDDSLSALDAPGLHITVIANDVNRGFSAACNQGAAGSTADYLLFLNPDTRLEFTSIRIPLSYMQLHHRSGVGIVGIQLLDLAGEITRSCTRFPRPISACCQALQLDKILPCLFPSHFMNNWDHQSTRLVDQVIGAFFMVARPLFEELKGFDERFFVYYEDADFAYRAHKTGSRCVYLATARAFHRGKGTTDGIPATRLFYSARSRIQYFAKHFPGLPFALVCAATLIWEPAIRMAHGLLTASLARTIESLQFAGKLWKWALAALFAPADHLVVPSSRGYTGSR